MSKALDKKYGAVIRLLRDSAARRECPVLTADETEDIIDLIDRLVELGHAGDTKEHLRRIPKSFAGVVITPDGDVPADGRLIHWLIDEVERRDRAIALLDREVSILKKEVTAWRGSALRAVEDA